MRVYIVVILILSFAGARSQSAQIGIGMVDLSTNYQNIASKDTLTTGKTRSNFNFKPVLTFNYLKKNNIEYAVQAGYFHERTYNANKSLFADKSVGIQTNKTVRNTIYLKLGIGRRIDYKRIYISYGLQVPLSATIYNYNVTKSLVNDSVGNYLGLTTSTNSLPTTYYVGLLMNFGSFYKFCKNFAIGGEVQYGLYYSLQYGDRTYTNIQANTSGVYYNSKQVLHYNNSSFQLVMVPTIHLRYTIFNKKSDQEVKPLNQ